MSCLNSLQICKCFGWTSSQWHDSKDKWETGYPSFRGCSCMYAHSVCLQFSYENGIPFLAWVYLTCNWFSLPKQRLSELSCFAVTQLLMLGKSIISNANKVADQDVKEESWKIDWPEDSIERANVIRAKAQSMIRCVEAVSSSFVTCKLASSMSFCSLRNKLAV